MQTLRSEENSEPSEMNTQTRTDGLKQVESVQEESGIFSVQAAFLHGQGSEQMASSRGEGEECGASIPRSSHAKDCDCADMLHQLANTVNAVLLHIQVMEWKLPPYSRLKRPVREVGRHAQRSAGLLERLLRQFETREETIEELRFELPSLHGTMSAVTVQGPEATAGGPEKLPPSARSPSAPRSCLFRKRTHKAM